MLHFTIICPWINFFTIKESSYLKCKNRWKELLTFGPREVSTKQELLRSFKPHLVNHKLNTSHSQEYFFDIFFHVSCVQLPKPHHQQQNALGLNHLQLRLIKWTTRIMMNTMKMMSRKMMKLLNLQKYDI